MESLSPPPMHNLDFNSFMEFAEFMALPSDRVHISEYKMHSKMGFLAQVFFNIGGEQLIYADVTYYNAFRFMKDVVLMFTDLPQMEN